ncbi:MAG TPA: NYN domain-containing protein [Acidimicrobiales bacterium]
MAAAEPPVSMLRPALELAWAVAKVGSQSRPPLPVPGRLRPLMKASRLPDRMLNTVRDVLEGDGAFRERVVHAAEEEILGRPSWLWLTRPEGWEEELGQLVDEAARLEEAEEEKRTTRATQRHLDETNAALQKLRAEMASLQTLNSQLEVEVSLARKGRREAEEADTKIRSALEDARAGQEELRATAAQLAARVEELQNDERAARDRATKADRERDEARREVEVLDLALAQAQRQTVSGNAEADSLRRLLADVLAAARTAASEAGIDAETIDAETETRAEYGAGAAPEPPPRVDEMLSGPVPGSARRVPARLPPAIFDESPEAAQHLVRLPGAVLVVDGYNVTLSSWSGSDLPSQRRRLVDSLAELSMRAGTEVLVIFDGIDDGNRLQMPSSVRGRMRVRFTASEVEADEAIVDLVDSLPAQRAVVVATNDRQVRESAARRGANVITVDQLLAVVGRGRT